MPPADRPHGIHFRVVADDSRQDTWDGILGPSPRPFVRTDGDTAAWLTMPDVVDPGQPVHNDDDQTADVEHVVVGH
jgi:hypothetical protein